MPECTDSTGFEANCVFRGVEYVVCIQVKEAHRPTLSVMVEDRLTANQWKGTFDVPYIEDMTHKTGNYKQFSVFVNMLESAISQSSDSVNLDLLTFSDLELLRKKKAGVGTATIPGANNPSLTQKRYLILTYIVEFDKIHYPLPLPYAGKPEPEVLQDTIRRLQTELKALKQHETRDYRLKELNKLKTDYDILLAEKEAVEQEYLLFRKELKHSSQGQASKEIRILKNITKNLEEELLREKAKHQRAAAKRRKEHDALREEVQELHASERNLRVRLKSLTNELAVYKRKAIAAEHPRQRSTRKSRCDNDTSNFRERSLSRNQRSVSQERPPTRGRDGSRERRSFTRDRSHSRERSTAGADRRNGYGHTTTNRPKSHLARMSSPRHITQPSPSGSRVPRFDPTAFIEEKRRKQTQRTRSSPRSHAPSSEERVRPRNVRSSPDLYSHRWSRNSSVDSSHTGSVRRKNSCNRGYSASEDLLSGDERQNKRSHQAVHYSASDDSLVSLRGRSRSSRTPNTSTPAHRFNIHNYSQGTPPTEPNDDDIDARLQRIQDMMRAAI